MVPRVFPSHRLIVLSNDDHDAIAGGLIVRDGTTIPHLVLRTIAERLAASSTAFTET